MIKAKHSNFADRIFQPYIRHLLRKHFYAIHMFGEIPAIHPDEPILLLPNHSSWWDGFFIYLFNKSSYRRKIWLMMLEYQLRQNMFFSRLGAFSVNRSTPGHIRETIRYAEKILQKSGSILCIFPQGELIHWGKRPIVFKKGIDLTTRNVKRPYSIILLAIKIEFLEQQRPEAFLLPGPVIRITDGKCLDLPLLENLETKLLEKLQQMIIKKEKTSILLKGRRSINDKISTLKQKARFS